MMQIKSHGIECEGVDFLTIKENLNRLANELAIYITQQEDVYAMQAILETKGWEDKIKAIKRLRELSGEGLKECKELVEKHLARIGYYL